MVSHIYALSFVNVFNAKQSLLPLWEKVPVGRMRGAFTITPHQQIFCTLTIQEEIGIITPFRKIIDCLEESLGKYQVSKKTCKTGGKTPQTQRKYAFHGS